MAENSYNTIDFETYLVRADLDHGTLSSILMRLRQDTRYDTGHFQILIQRTNNILEREDDLTSYHNTFFRYDGEYVATTQDAAFVMLRDAIHALLAVNARDLAYELIVAAAPPEMQFLEAWEQIFHEHNDENLHAPEYDDENLHVPEDDDENLHVPVGQVQQVSNNTVLDPSLPQQPFLPVATNTDTSSLSIPPQSVYQSTPQPAPQNISHPSSATTNPTSEMARTPTARDAIRESDKKKRQQKKTPAKSTKPRGVSKQKKEPTKKTSANLGRQGATTEVSRILGKARVPEGSRWLCPYNVTDKRSGKKCMRIFTYRPDVKAHVKRQHHNGKAGWGDRVEDWKHCGHYTRAQLRARGVTFRKDKDEPEEEDDDEDEEGDEESVNLSDGDHPPNQEDDDDMGGDGGHALAQLVAVV